MHSTGPHTENPQTSAIDCDWSEAALDRAEHAESSRTPRVGPATHAPMEATRPGPTPWQTIAVVGTVAILPWLVLLGFAYLVYVLA